MLQERGSALRPCLHGAARAAFLLYGAIPRQRGAQDCTDTRLHRLVPASVACRAASALSAAALCAVRPVHGAVQKLVHDRVSQWQSPHRWLLGACLGPDRGRMPW